MINWRNGKAGFVGGLKYAIKGFFQYAYSVTTATAKPLSDATFSGIVKSNIYSGAVKTATYSGIVKSDTFSGEVKESSYSGIIKSSTFSGIR